MNPDERRMELAEERTSLARERTKLAKERTILSDMRTGATFTLFGITFMGLSTDSGPIFFYAGVTAITLGAIMLGISMVRGMKNQKRIRAIREKIKNRRKKISGKE